jgi:queuine tRNA-ribosyltransferase
MSWDRPLLTDSGGFQVFSLARTRRVTDDGVEFQSHLDGSTVALSPERVIEIELQLGADIIMPLDQPVAHPCGRAAAEEAMHRTHRWLARCRAEWRRRACEETALFGIVQGSVFEDLRRASTEAVLSHELPGLAIGGLSVGEPQEEMLRAVGWVTGPAPERLPRYLMGAGMPSDLVRAVAAGIDMFDCILPTRLARNGTVFTSTGILKIRNRMHSEEASPLDPACSCPACRTFSRAYLRHGFMSNEILIHRLLTIHNLTFYFTLMKRIREAIRNGTMSRLIREVESVHPPSDIRDPQSSV